MEMDPGQGYAAGLEQIFKSSQLALKDSIAHFQEMCHMVTPERNLPHDIVVDIRKSYREIQDQLTKIKGIQQLLEGKYRQHYRRNPQRDREIMELGVLAKNYYLRFEFTLKEAEAKKKLREQEKSLRKYGQMGPIPWFLSEENQGILLKNLRSLSDLDYKISNGLWAEERRQVIQSSLRSLSLFVLSGEAEVIDDLEGRVRLRKYDITERYGPDEFRGALAHLKEISIAEVEKVMRRLMQSGEFSKPKGLLFSIQSSKNLRKEMLASTKRLLQGLAPGDMKTLSI
jgi:hypothetical protein